MQPAVVIHNWRRGLQRNDVRRQLFTVATVRNEQLADRVIDMIQEILAGGVLYFRRMERSFADVV